MNLLAAATTPAQPAPAYNPAYQNQTYQQSTTTQQATPPPRQIKIGYVQLFLSAFNLVVVLFVLFMVFKFVRAFEKIAKRVDNGIVIKKDDTTT